LGKTEEEEEVEFEVERGCSPEERSFEFKTWNP
jgi:hypothetical protein